MSAYLCLEVYEWLVPWIRVVLKTLTAPWLIRTAAFYGARRLITALFTRLSLSGQLNLFYIWFMSRDSVLPAGARNFLFKTAQTVSVPTQPPLGTGSFPWIKRSGREVDHSCLSSVEVKLFFCSLYMPSWRGYGKLYLFYLTPDFFKVRLIGYAPVHIYMSVQVLRLTFYIWDIPGLWIYRVLHVTPYSLVWQYSWWPRWRFPHSAILRTGYSAQPLQIINSSHLLKAIKFIRAHMALRLRILWPSALHVRIWYPHVLTT